MSMPSMRLPPTKHQVAAASPLRAAAPPPLVQAADFQRAFLGAYVAGGHAAAPTRTIQLRCPPQVVVCCTRSSSPSPRTNVPGCRRAASHGAGRQVYARSSSTAGFFLAYFDYRRRTTIGYVHGHFWPSPFPPPTPSSLSTTSSSLTRFYPGNAHV
jgi:hypothetical protein